MTSDQQPGIAVHDDGPFVTVSGAFFRSIAMKHLDLVLAGSVRAGRYSAPDQPTLYLSSSADGIAAAMRKYDLPDGETRVVCRLHVEGGPVFDLRDEAACRQAGIDPADATLPWSVAAARGEIVPSWRVRDQLMSLGAAGLIDPSRTAPGLWHLVLFDWNKHGAPAVRLIE